jgi:hypothetical protein
MAARTDIPAQSTGWTDYIPGDWQSWIKESSIVAASYLTDPVCMMHISFRQSSTVDDLNPDSYRVANWARKSFYWGKAGFCAGLAIASLPGMAIRYAVCRLQKEPYTHRRGGAPEKITHNGQFTQFAANVACNSSGHSITDAGVVPWPYRIEALARKILRQNADVVTLYEVFDPEAAYSLFEKMKGEYAHFYFNMGPRVIGVNSGIFVASKYAIKNPKFIPFPKDMLVDRTKNAEKGIFSCDLECANRIFATIITSHLQHSEEPAHATPDESRARWREMNMIMDEVHQTAQDRAVILVGDLNIDDLEYETYLPWISEFTKNHNFKGKFTWGGDGWCKKLVGGQRSGPLNLDHCLLVKGTAQNIATDLVTSAGDDNIEFDGDKFQAGPLSDHNWLLSRITLRSS